MLRLAYTYGLILLLGMLPRAVLGQETVPDTLVCAAFPFDAPRHSPPDTTFDVVHAALALEIDDDGTASFTGRASLEIRLTTDTDSLLLLNPLHTVDSVLFGAAALKLDAEDADTLRLELPDTVAAGPLARLLVYFRGRLDRPAEDLVVAMDPLTPWFPSSPNPHDRFTSDLHVTVPSDWSVVATGVSTGQRSSGDGQVTFRFSSPYELPGRRFGFAAGVVDSGTEFAALPGGRRPAVSWWMPRARASDRPRSPDEALSVATERLAFFSRWTGFPIPFERYTQLHVDGDPAALAGLVRVPALVEPDDRGGTPYAPPAALTKPLLQQWFGVLLSATSWQHIWLEEAFPAYLNALEPAVPHALSEAMAGYREAYLEAVDGTYRPLEWDRWHHPSELLDVQTSARGAWVLHMLRRSIGDEAFREAVDLFLTRNQHQTVTTADWLQAVESVVEEDVSAFADDWIYSGGHPVLEVDYADEGNVVRVRIEQVQTGDFVPTSYAMNLTLEVGTLDSAERFDVQVDERVETFELPVSTEPRFVAVDPDGEWLLESRTDQSASSWVAQLRHATSPFARLAAARALNGSPQDSALLLALRAALEAEASAPVRAAIVDAIGSIPRNAAAERTLIAAYDDAERGVRRTVLRVLADSAATSAASELALHAAETDEAYDVQAEAVRTLARIGSSNALDVTRAALITLSHDELIRSAGLDALADLHAQAPNDALEEGLRHSVEEQPRRLRLAAVRLLGRLGATEAGDRLAELLSDADPAVVDAAVNALRVSGRASHIREHLEDVSDPRLIASLTCP